jgi:hypothetical protein
MILIIIPVIFIGGVPLLIRDVAFVRVCCRYGLVVNAGGINDLKIITQY